MSCPHASNVRDETNEKGRAETGDAPHGRDEPPVADGKAVLSSRSQVGLFVVESELSVETDGADALEQAFSSRLGEVEGWPGFHHLEVWRDVKRDGSYRMITWWENEDSFRSYMRSQEHKRSHERIPVQPSKARGVGLRRHIVIAT